jgi:hypothetical protein
MSDSYSIIFQAIQERVPVIATYNGARRLLCPHALGTKKGRPQALFYQVAGGSSSDLSHRGAFSNWRCMSVENLSDVQFRPGPWYSGGNHSCPHT